MNGKDWQGVEDRIDEYDKANTWEHLDKFDKDDKELLSTCCGAGGLGNIHEFDGEHYGLCVKCKDHCDFEYEEA